MQNVLDILEERCLLEDATSPEIRKVVEKPVTVYAGFDPTSESLQAGNFVTIMALAHFQRCGHNVVALVGGATGMIGDPSGKSSERPSMSEDEVDRNLEGIRENLARFLDFDDPDATARIVNNNDWLADFSFVGFLRDVGKHFRMGAMLGKESVRARLESETGMSYAEFSYQLLQAYDFLRLYDDMGCTVQIGGSDQWGNITAGIDLIRKQRGAEAFGVTMPLICDSTGKKFGKSEGNAIYLDHTKTSYYDFYQFFLRTDDADVIRFLKVFTFVPISEIVDLEESMKKHAEGREAQQRLAEEVTRTVHGEHGLQVAVKASAVLFGESMEGLDADDLLDVFAHVPSIEMPSDEVVGQTVVDVAAASGLCASKSEARRLATGGGLYFNNRRAEGLEQTVADGDVVGGRVLVLRSGKKRYHLIKVV